MRGDDDDYEQVGADLQFATTLRDQPWIQGGGTPWHMWGNTQVIEVPIIAQIVGPMQLKSNQLTKISYKRPESWHWLFAARTVDGPTPAGGSVRLLVFWDLTLGLGRSVFQTGDPTTTPGSTILQTFDAYSFTWSSAPGFVRNARIWTTETFSPQRAWTNFGTIPDPGGNAVPPEPNPTVIRSVPAQDIQLDVRLFAQQFPPPNTDVVGQTVQVEVSAFWSPKVHIRPEWLQLDVPPEAQFPGAEIGGR